MIKKYGGLFVSFFSFLIGSLEMMVIALLVNIGFIGNFFSSLGLEKFVNVPFFAGYTMSNIPIMLYIYIVVTGLGFCAYFLSMEKTSAAQTSLVFFFKPALAPLLALIILNEAISVNMAVGIGFILLGSITSLYPALKNSFKKS